MARKRATLRVLTLAEFMAKPRTPQEVETYHQIVGGLMRLGVIEPDPNPTREATP